MFGTLFAVRFAVEAAPKAASVEENPAIILSNN